MLKWLKLAASILLGLIILYAGYKLYQRVKAPRGLQSKITTYFLKADTTESLYTGFSFVALLEFFDSKGNPLTDLPKVYVDENKRIKGVCYRFYEIGLGYPNLGKALSDTLPPEPEILSVNAIDSRVIGGAKAQYHCDRIDTDPKTRSEKLKAQMMADQQWQAQAQHARGLIALLKVQFGDTLKDGASSAEIKAQISSSTSAVGLGAGHLGNLKLTFATVGTFTATKRFLIFFTLDAGFYIRKDITEVTYGSQLSGLSVDAPIFGFSADKVTLTLEEPDLIAVNRYIDLLIASKDFVYKNEQEQKNIDTFMREDFENHRKAIHARAVEHSKRLAQLFARKYGVQEDLQIELEFKPKPI
ncbi:MAG: hypothetical protein ACREOO_19420 [bacterium]